MSRARYLQKGGPITGSTSVMGQAGAELEAVADGLTGQRLFGQIIGRSQAIRAQIDKIQPYACSDFPVLIIGETGTGKEVFARAIHDSGPRCAQRFVAVYGALPVELVENELFGHVLGAFTGASRPHSGLIEQAHGGTLFLDEIDSFALIAQPKLLRFLEDGQCRALGSALSRRFDVRVISASNRNLEEAVRAGHFRADLYFRLNVLTLTLPPLRQRREDIPLLADFLLARLRLRLTSNTPDWSPEAHLPIGSGEGTGHGHLSQRANLDELPASFTPGAFKKLMGYNWPGNIRELANVIERAVTLSTRAVLDERDFDLCELNQLNPAAAGQCFDAQVASFQCVCLKEFLARNGGNITRAAEAVGKSRRAFFELLRKHHLTQPTFRARSGRNTISPP